MEKVHFLSVKDDVPATGYWDHAFLNDILADLNLSEANREIVVIPGAYQADSYEEINRRLAEFQKIMVFITSDEEGKFDVRKLVHSDMIVYSQYGNGGKMWPLGYSTGTREKLKEKGLQTKDLNIFFAGQVTHERRKQMMARVEHRKDAYFEKTTGFAKGLDRNLYFELMGRAKTVLCPPGPISQDSFRLYEALEAGAMPIADDVSPLRSSTNYYWYHLFGDAPFAIYTEYDQIEPFIDLCLEDPDLNNRIFAWWINKKYRLKTQLKLQLGIPLDDIAVIVPVSPIPSHPSTKIIDETIRSIRAHLPTAPILVTMDGVRKEDAGHIPSYREFIRQFLWKCNFEYKDVLPVIFSKHKHQSGMMKVVLEQVGMPYLLYVEHDTPLTPDREIPWDDLKRYIARGDTNLIRFHFEAFIPEPHKHLMHGYVHTGAPLMKTTQWSQRPHLTTLDYYKRIMADHFSDKSKTYIETRMHGVVQQEGWDKHKLTIYHPSGDIKRSYHLDGRAGAKSYEYLSVF